MPNQSGTFIISFKVASETLKVKVKTEQGRYYWLLTALG